MTKNQNSDAVGDVRMPLLQPTETGLRFGPDQAEMLSADQSPIVQKPSPLGTFSLTLRQVEPGPVTTCKQRLLSWTEEENNFSGMNPTIFAKTDADIVPQQTVASTTPSAGAEVHG